MKIKPTLLPDYRDQNSFDELVSNPIGWFTRRFLIYGTAALLTAPAFLIGAWIYAV